MIVSALTCALVEGERERAGARGRPSCRLPLRELGGEALRLAAEAVHQLGAQDAFRESGIVVDVGGQHELAAGHVGGIVAAAAFDHQRLQVRARGVEGGGQAGGARPEDDDAVFALLRHGVASITVASRAPGAHRARRCLDSPGSAGYGRRMPVTARIDVLLSTLNATDVGTLDSIQAKLEQVRAELLELDQPELAARATEALAALARGDVAEFKRGTSLPAVEDRAPAVAAATATTGRADERRSLALSRRGSVGGVSQERRAASRGGVSARRLASFAGHRAAVSAVECRRPDLRMRSPARPLLDGAAERLGDARPARARRGGGSCASPRPCAGRGWWPGPRPPPRRRRWWR